MLLILSCLFEQLTCETFGLENVEVGLQATKILPRVKVVMDDPILSAYCNVLLLIDSFDRYDRRIEDQSPPYLEKRKVSMILLRDGRTKRRQNRVGCSISPAVANGHVGLTLEYNSSLSGSQPWHCKKQ
jgi:hypothetical protein